MVVMVMIIIIFTLAMMIRRRQHCCVINGLIMLVLPLLTLSFTCGVMTCFRRLDRIQTA